MKRFYGSAVFGLAVLLVITCMACKSIEKFTGSGSVAKKGLSEQQIVAGLKDALKVGTKSAVGILNRNNGFNGDAGVRVLFPPDAIRAEQKLRQIGFGRKVDEFIVQMNRGAERAVSEAVRIITDAVVSMTFQDAKGILFGADNAATEYFRRKTTNSLISAFGPHIKNALDAVNATTLWRDITTMYNRIPGVNKVQTDLVRYVTDRALAGLFAKLELEERKIRKQPLARVTDILKLVFAELDNR